MQQLLKWTLEAIREEDCFSWMEERRDDWVPLVRNAVAQLAEGKTMLVATDEPRAWFGRYIVDHINLPEKNRPFFPVFPFERIFPHISRLTHTQDIELAEDMLDIAFPSGYFIWYIGKSEHALMKPAHRKDGSFLWILDEVIGDSFYLRESDPLLDIKLLQLFKLFDKTLNEALFGELDLEG
jgi:hypothetical protein